VKFSNWVGASGDHAAVVFLGLRNEFAMPLSARNQLPGKVHEVRLGEVMAHVIVRVGSNVIESVITRTSAEELKLKKGDAVTVVIKSTEVVLQND